ncbi:MAG: DUF2807 domain-containing protein [Porphyromonadaceae bacterium]|nr:MAG: DUF2807 domain-containing protein [Porphyromonadaceae bacterium]
MKTKIYKSGWLMLLSLALVILTSCQGGIIGNGKVETRDQKIGNFTRLVISGNFHVFLEPSDKPSLRMELDENLYDIVKVSEEGSTLRIETRLNILQARDKNLYIGIKDLEKMELSGAIKMVSDSVLRLGSLNILATGAARLDFGIEAKSLKIDLSGASECDFRGKVDELRIQLSGAGDIDALDLMANDVEVDMSGAGGARVYAKDKLDVSISGIGSVRYRGEPEIHKNISGLGSLKRD